MRKTLGIICAEEGLGEKLAARFSEGFDEVIVAKPGDPNFSREYSYYLVQLRGRGQEIFEELIRKDPRCTIIAFTNEPYDNWFEKLKLY